MLRGPAWLGLSDPPWLRLGRWGSLAFLAAGFAIIVLGHLALSEDAERLDAKHASPAGIRGIYTSRIQPFFYFFYYTQKFPITYRGARSELPENRDVAWGLLLPREKSKLANENYAAIRKGDLGQIFLLYPDAWRHGTAMNATARTFNRSLSLVSSLALFASLCLLGHRLLASVLVALIGSHPYAVYQLYQGINVWGYPIAVGSLMLALSAPLLFSARRHLLHLAIPLFAGVFLACAREVRTEPALLGASVALACVLAPGGWRWRTALLAVLVAAFAGTSHAWLRYWEAKTEEAYEIVEATGGRSFRGLANTHHSLWHPIWWGLGDFDDRYGYRSWDIAAYAYAIPILNERHGLDLKVWKHHLYQLQNRDPRSPRYRMKLETLPAYNEVLREKVLHDVANDPVWYASILARRLDRILALAPPVRLGWGAHTIDIPFSAWLFLPVLALAVLRLRRDEIGVLLFYAPTSLPALLIYSKGGFTNPTAFHLSALAVLACWLVQGATAALAALRPARTAVAAAEG